MATAVIQDYRRTDLRTNVLENPFWISSGVVDGSLVAIDDLACVLFSFPVAGQLVFVEQVMIDIITGFTSGTTIDIGLYTLATDAVTTGGEATLVDADEFLANASITEATPGTYGPAACDWLTAKIAAVNASPYVLTGAASTVPAVVLTAANAGTIIIGKARVHMLISIKP